MKNTFIHKVNIKQVKIAKKINRRVNKKNTISKRAKIAVSLRLLIESI